MNSLRSALTAVLAGPPDPSIRAKGNHEGLGPMTGDYRKGLANGQSRSNKARMVSASEGRSQKSEPEVSYFCTTTVPVISIPPWPLLWPLSLIRLPSMTLG